MGSIAKEHGWTRGAGRPSIPGVYEIQYMGRRMLVNVKRDRFPGLSGKSELLVYGVPGHMKEGLPVSDFNMYFLPKTDDSRRSAASNLGEYDRAISRVVAALTAMAATGKKDSPNERLPDGAIEAWSGCAMDREGVEKAVEERLGVWDHEDHEAIPLPSDGPGAPPKDKDLHGKDV